MKIFDQRDRVQVIIPAPHDPDHQYHQKTGTVIDVYQDDLSGITSDPRHDYLYTVDFEDDDLGSMDFRYDDLVPLQS